MCLVINSGCRTFRVCQLKTCKSFSSHAAGCTSCGKSHDRRIRFIKRLFLSEKILEQVYQYGVDEFLALCQHFKRLSDQYPNDWSPPASSDSDSVCDSSP
jgi:hypothetical protein